MRLHLNKPGLRVLGVAESFRPKERWSVLAGVAMRGDLVVDGVVFGRSSVGGEDATRSIESLYRRTHRNDINVIMVSGCILSVYNIVDADSLSDRTKLPVVCLTYRETAGIEGAILRHFPGRAEEKLAAYRKLGERKRFALRSGGAVYARVSGLADREAAAIVDRFTLQGSVPEPVRVARLLARAGSAVRRS